MKKLFILSGFMAGSIFSANAQTPEKKSRAVVFKFTETWCAPCGTFGWNLANQVVDSIGDNGYYVGVMGSSGDSLNANCWSPFQNNFTLSGYPSFVVNDYQTVDFFSSIKDKYEKFAATVPLASPAGISVISGSSLSVTTKTKFWSSATGEYYITAFLIEDKVKAKQNGQTGIVEHHYIMRGSLMPDFSPWGQKLDSGTIAASSEFNNSFSMPLKSEWIKSNISVLLIVYKKVGDKYQLVNSVKAENSSTDINERSFISEVNIYPNPASNAINIDGVHEGSKIALYDFFGRKVLDFLPVQSNTASLNISSLGAGSYVLKIVTREGLEESEIIQKR